MELGHPSGYRSLLKEEFQDRQRRNKSFSLRSFARLLKVSPTTLTYVLQGKRSLGEKSIEQITKSLNMSSVERRTFRAMVLAEDGENEEIRSRYKTELKELEFEADDSAQTRRLDIDQFKIISDWQCLAILEALDLSQIKNEPVERANALVAFEIGEPETVVKDCINRLLRIGIITIRNDRYARTSKTVYAGDQAPSAAITNFHRSYLKKAETALDEEEPDKRYFSSLVIPMDEEIRGEVAELIKDFRRKVRKLILTKRRAPTKLVYLGTQFLI